MADVNERITMTLRVPVAEDLIAKLTAKGVEAQKISALRQAGGGEFATIVLPITLTAVQVAATFIAVYLGASLAAKNSEKKPPDAPSQPETGKIEIKIGRIHISHVKFSVEEVEKAIGHPLSDD